MPEQTHEERMLTIALSAAVPLWAFKLREMEPMLRWRQIRIWVDDAIDILAGHDELLFHRGKDGETAQAFNSVARAIAGLSYLPGGISIYGQHWESKEPARGEVP